MIKYWLYFWNPPILTPEQEIEAGRQIVMSGGASEWKKKAPYMPDEQRRHVERAAEHNTIARKFVAIAFFIALFVGAVAMGPRAWIPMGIICVTVLPLSLFSLLQARRRYYKWVDDMVETYLRANEKVLQQPSGNIARLK